MSLTVFFAVILAAFFHAVWNAMVKKGDDKYISLTAIVLGHVPISIAIIFFTPILSIQSIPYIFISVIFLTGYEWWLLSAYRLEDFTKVYPIARGTAPIFIIILSFFLFGLYVSKFELIGILVISFGIIILSFQKIKTSTIQSRATAGVANGKILFALPGSTGACKDGWDEIIAHQLDSTHKPCNLVELMPRMLEK